MKKPISLALLLFTAFLAWGSLAGAENTSDETLRVSATDTTSGKLDAKLVGGAGINVDNLVPTGDQKLTISAKDKLVNQGDLLTNDGGDDKTLAVGTNGQVLVVDLTTANGIKWDDGTDFSAPGPIGDTTASTGDFTTLNATDYEWKGLRQIVFVLEVKNDGGTIKHRVQNLRKTSGSPGTDGFTSGISGLSGTFGNTPTLSSSVDFVNGVGIRPAVPTNLMFDFDVTQDAGSTGAFLIPILIQDTTGNNLAVLTGASSESINGGASKFRLSLALADSVSGATVNWNTSNIPSGKYLKIIVMGYVNV
ncbi:MAG: hypothetical protein HN472_08360 [Nitrospina sp.]|jgi:hypothetical protein|nr:hypothetical protein [Nitrospina sp.]MBT3509540.1 hypothetical protein [Nitrospina sp.]MBT3876866.1 hypothetical protein [Nitrospina sp.]MBT4049054.1 hypothetical protein [Nitrospina sp.]MBT4556391.1 hypothetical protein [Nitrospina sp.]